MHTPGNPVVFVLSPGRTEKGPKHSQRQAWLGEKFKVCILLSSKKEEKKLFNSQVRSKALNKLEGK